jgi:DNA-binding GntR family transcriptional regulator
MAVKTLSRPDAPEGKGLLKEQAYADLKRRILNGEFVPGAFLSERQLALDLAMSKTPIRAAVERLESEGFLAISPQQGIVVRDLSVEELADHLEIRYALEPFVLRQIAGRLTREQSAELEENLAGQKAATRKLDVERLVELDTGFHMLFCRFHGNGEILRVMEQLRAKIHRIIRRMTGQVPGRPAASYAEHRAIADAVIGGDGALAARRMEEHLEVGKQFLLSPRPR